MSLPVLFVEPSRTRTALGLRLPWRAPTKPRRRRRLDVFERLLGGPHLAAFDAGVYEDA